MTDVTLKENIDTPAVIVDVDKMISNIKEMSDYAKKYNVKLRPHTKTHQIPEIAKIQLSYGANGICCQKVSEAEIMYENGITDILIPTQIIGQPKISRLFELAQKCKITTAVDSLDSVIQLDKYANKKDGEFNVIVEIDIGGGRCGMPIQKTLKFVNKITQLKGINVEGLMCYEGQAYNIFDHKKREITVNKIVNKIVDIAKDIKNSGIEIKEISVGSTPSAKISAKIDGVTEIRPGNYVFYDYMQVERDVIKQERCATTVITTVISKPNTKTAVVDAGKKSLCNDTGLLNHKIVGHDGKIKQMWEEHSAIDFQRNNSLKVGDKIEIIPYHVCTCVNMFNQLIGIKNNRIESKWKIAGRETNLINKTNKK